MRILYCPTCKKAALTLWGYADPSLYSSAYFIDRAKRQGGIRWCPRCQKEVQGILKLEAQGY